MLRSAHSFVVLLALVLFAQFGGIGQLCAAMTGQGAADLCASGCEDQGDSGPCSAACTTCSCAPMARGLDLPVDLQLADALHHLPAGSISGQLLAAPARAGQLLAAPARVDADGVLHPPRA